MLTNWMPHGKPLSFEAQEGILKNLIEVYKHLNDVWSAQLTDPKSDLSREVATGTRDVILLTVSTVAHKLLRDPFWSNKFDQAIEDIYIPEIERHV